MAAARSARRLPLAPAAAYRDRYNPEGGDGAPAPAASPVVEAPPGDDGAPARAQLQRNHNVFMARCSLPRAAGLEPRSIVQVSSA